MSKLPTERINGRDTRTQTDDIMEISQDKLDRLDEDLEEWKNRATDAERRLSDLFSALRNRYDVDPNDVVDGVAPEAKVKKVKGQAVKSPTIEWQDFPVEALPDPVADYARAVRAADSIDESMFAAPSLSVLGAAIGNSVHFELRPGWKEIPTIWTCPLMKSGRGKSPVFSKVRKPATKYDLKAQKEHERRMEDWKQRPEDERGERPKRRHFVINDITAESAGLRHGENPRGLLLYRDELAGFIGSMDQYKRGSSDLQTWIEMYDGNAVKIDRKSSDPPTLYVPNPAVCITGTMQPSVMRETLQPGHFQSGFAQRLWMIKPPQHKTKGWNRAGISRDVQRAYKNLVHSLYSIEYHRDVGPEVISMSSGADEIWGKWFEKCGEIKDTLSSDTLLSMVAKSQSLTARLALIFHVCDCVEEVPNGWDPLDAVREESPISRDAMVRAVTVGEWFQREAARVYQMYGFDERGVSRDTANARKLPSPFGWQDVADLWDVSKQGAYNIIERLTAQGLVEKTGHGEYVANVGDAPGGDFAIWNG